MANVGFAGLGKMGGVMAPRFIDAGHNLTVWNRSPGKADALKEKGAAVAATPAALSAASDAIVSMLTDDAAVETLYEGPDGFLSKPVAGKVFIEMSTLRPETMRKLAAKVTEAGGQFVDAPVSGTVAPAKDGKLLVLAGGNAIALQQATPYLNILSRRIIHAGPAGSGAMLKLAVNLLLGVYWTALAEAMALGVRGGLDPAMMLDAINDSSAKLAVLPLKVPHILGHGGPVAFDVASMQKDFFAILSTGSALGVPMAVSAAALSEYSAAMAAGNADADAVDVVKLLMDMARPMGAAQA